MMKNEIIESNSGFSEDEGWRIKDIRISVTQRFCKDISQSSIFIVSIVLGLEYHVMCRM